MELGLTEAAYPLAGAIWTSNLEVVNNLERHQILSKCFLVNDLLAAVWTGGLITPLFACGHPLGDAVFAESMLAGADHHWVEVDFVANAADEHVRDTF